MKLLAISALLALHGVALYGWGRAAERKLGLRVAAWPVSTGLGLALVIAFGGALNLLGWAYRPALWCLVVAGVVLAVPQLRAAAMRQERLHPLSVATLLASITVMLFVLATLVPAAAFNYHDDFQKYCAHPVRMLQLGRMSASTLSALGFETLGGQAFLHGFVLAFAGVDALNAVDLGLGLPLCLVLAGVGPTRGVLQVLGRLLAVAAVLLVNPQIVNISSSYTGVALFLTVLLLQADDVTAHGPGRADALATGLLLAALCALKSTFVLPALGLGATLSLAVGLYTRDGRRAVSWALACAGSAAACLLPWLLVHTPSYLAAFAPHARHALPQPTHPYSVDPWSAESVGYGFGFGPYTAAVATCMALGLLGWFVLEAREEPRPWRSHVALAAGLSLACVYVLTLYVVGPATQGPDTTLRLFVPMLLGNLPGIVVLLTRTSAPLLSPRRRIAAILALTLVGASIVPLSAGARDRLVQAARDGSVLSFALARRPWYFDYNRYVLYGDMQHQVAAAQAAVPAGEPLVAWINTTFQLDFRRNPIADADIAGLATPWTTMPASSYVIWEYDGAATRQLGYYEAARQQPGILQQRTTDTALRFARALLSMGHEAQIVHNDGQFMVLRLPSRSTLRERFDAP